jgi:hypothetical protein
MELISVGQERLARSQRYLVSSFKGVSECRINLSSKNSKAAKVANNRAAAGRSRASSNGSPSKSPVGSPKAKSRAAPKAWAAAQLRLSE